jgi:glyoxylase-like metal-dependent hydrolase (beta-lactamase superfamily II)
MITRRTALTLGAATAASALLPAGARAQATPHTFAVGSFAVTVISDGSISLPLSMLLPKTDPKIAADMLGPNGPTAQVNVVVVKTPDRLVVIDSGGTKDFLPNTGAFADRFEAAGFAPDDVTDVIFTHAHPDHLWGAIDALDEARFAKARHHVTIAERDFWMKDGLAETMPEGLKGMAVGSARRLKILEPLLVASKPGIEIAPGFSYVDTPGHTPGHGSVLITSGSAQLLVGGDALSSHIVSFEKPDWVWGADTDTDKGIATRKMLLDRLATDKTALLGYHLPWPGIGRVERKDSAYRFVAG